MTRAEHKRRHKKLHEKLDELAADYIRHVGGIPSKITVIELMSWSYKQTTDPDEVL